MWIKNWDVIKLKPPLKLYTQLVTVKLLIYVIVFTFTSFMLKSSAKCLVDCSGYREKHLEAVVLFFFLKKNPSFSKEKQLLSILLLVLLLFLFITIRFSVSGLFIVSEMWTEHLHFIAIWTITSILGRKT